MRTTKPQQELSRRRWLAAAAAASASVLPLAARAQAGAAPKSFEAQVRRGARSLHDSSVVLQEADGRWRRHWLAIDELNYDVQRHASLLRPALGTLGVKLALRSGDAHADRRGAEQDRVAPSGAASRFVRYDLWFQPEAAHWSFMDGDASASSRPQMDDRQWWSVTAASARAAASLDAVIVGAFSAKTARA